MKKLFSTWYVVSAVFMLLALSAVSASAQSYEWTNPQTVPDHVTGIAVDPVTETKYGIDDSQNVVAITTGTEVTDVFDATAGATAPVLAIATDAHGTLYAISPTTVSTCPAGTCTAVDPQPKLPTGVTLGDLGNAAYKDIAVGKGGKLYVLLELADKTEYLLIGYPPAVTQGVTIIITPTVLNLASKGNWVSASVTAPEGYDAEDILPETVKIVRVQGTGPMGTIDLVVDISKADGAPYGVRGDKLNLKFARYNKQDPSSSQSLVGLIAPVLPAGDAKAVYNLTLTIEGQLETGEYFSGTTPLTVMVAKAKVAKNKK